MSDKEGLILLSRLNSRNRVAMNKMAAEAAHLLTVVYGVLHSTGDSLSRKFAHAQCSASAVLLTPGAVSFFTCSYR